MMNVAPAQLTKQDADQLDLLGILFYVYGALTLFGALAICGFALIPALLGAAAASGPQSGDAAASAFVGGVLLIVFGAIGVVLLVKAIVSMVAGAGLRKRSSYAFVMVGAALALLNMPLGTMLGIFTFIVLQRPAVRAAFR